MRAVSDISQVFEMADTLVFLDDITDSLNILVIKQLSMQDLALSFVSCAVKMIFISVFLMMWHNE